MGNGFGCSVFGPADVTRTLSARYHKDGSEIPIRQNRKMFDQGHLVLGSRFI